MVFVVLNWNYGDQGCDYLGVFGTREKAEAFTRKHLKEECEKYNYSFRHDEQRFESELQSYSIIETEIQ